jgi:hypothetical protein
VAPSDDRAHARDRAAAVSAEQAVVAPVAPASASVPVAAAPAALDRVRDLLAAVAVLVAARPGPVVPLPALAMARAVLMAAERLARGRGRPVVLRVERVPESAGRPVGRRAAGAFRRLVEQGAERVVPPFAPVPVHWDAGGHGTPAAVAESLESPTGRAGGAPRRRRDRHRVVARAVARQPAARWRPEPHSA